MICLCLTGATQSEWTRQIERNRHLIGLVELRIDLLAPRERGGLGKWWRQIGGGLGLILTIRRRCDMGCWDDSEVERLQLYQELLPVLEPNYLDIEIDRRGDKAWDRLARAARKQQTVVIRSQHEARELPANLSATMDTLAANEAEVPKLAALCRSTADLIRLLAASADFYQRLPQRAALWIGMGEYGQVTRLLPAHVGNRWTYAVEKEAVAPGQVALSDLAHLYRAQTAQKQWATFAVVGTPIAHSASPRYHNTRFARAGVPAVYVPMRLDNFHEFAPLARLLGLRGVSVTVPHKEAALRHATAASGETRTIGAANTLLLLGGGERWRATNTDVEGFLAPLAKNTWQGATVAVIGAGGAARAVVAGLLRLGCRVVVFNRSLGRARALARDFGLKQAAAQPLAAGEGIAAWRAAQGAPPHLIVQASSVGLDGCSDPAPQYAFAGSETLYEIIYTPPETPLMRRARTAGCTTISGAAMFAAQAARQYTFFEALANSESR